VNDLESRSRSELFTVEEVIARSVTVLEQLIEKFETDRHMILEQYYKYWLHRQVSQCHLLMMSVFCDCSLVCARINCS